MKTINLTRGQKTLVDDDDYEHLNKFKWFAKVMGKNLKNKYYAIRSCHFKKPDGKQTCRVIYMHRLILGIDKTNWKELEVDHIDGDTLNNTKANLRKATRSQNCANKKSAIKNKSGFKGVQIRENGKFQAYIKVNQKVLILGTYPTKEQASESYNLAAKKYFNEFATINQ